jgi:glycosyltransferase involved in cell wall biosynthesis
MGGSRGQHPAAPRAAAASVSVVMPVRNEIAHLDQAIESILAQSFSDFEFVILDDASSDGSLDRLREWQARDKRIRLIEAKQHLGPAMSSHTVASAASGQLVARMDADDISRPERLEQQLQVLHDYPEAGVVGCICDFIDKRGKRLRGADIWRIARHSWFVPFAHGAMMYRRELFDRVGGYRRKCEYWEDLDLVTRMARLAPVMVIPKPLYRVRLSTTSTRVSSDRVRLEHAVDLMYQAVARLERGVGYEDLLRPADDSTKLNPRVFISLGSQALWAGGKPRLFSRLIRLASLKFDFTTVSALAWTAWASASPSSLRAFLRLLIGARNRLASRRVATDSPIAWHSPDELK